LEILLESHFIILVTSLSKTKKKKGNSELFVAG